MEIFFFFFLATRQSRAIFVPIILTAHRRSKETAAFSPGDWLFSSGLNSEINIRVVECPEACGGGGRRWWRRERQLERTMASKCESTYVKQFKMIRISRTQAHNRCKEAAPISIRVCVGSRDTGCKHRKWFITTTTTTEQLLFEWRASHVFHFYCVYCYHHHHRRQTNKLTDVESMHPKLA